MVAVAWTFPMRRRGMTRLMSRPDRSKPTSTNFLARYSEGDGRPPPNEAFGLSI